MVDSDYVKQLEERVEQLEGLLANECVVADDALEKARQRVRRAYLSIRGKSGYNSVFSVSHGRGIRISIEFRGEEDYSMTVPWKHCMTVENIKKYLERLYKKMNSSEEDEYDY